ncbi:molybdopterin-guanine dinucleotide biosynthesis protein A [Luteibacter sp. Sphag1AF]|uniref:molybdenum cofactor guanylyltransferase n=1 Tax=Luteibacter sp. Sphag1AF TaxID=2587031 RepID=UPI00160BB0C6|nr:molybdenum cofactor guanylyltransferase [Luteibacter sp. Sphag1AF]MBB3226034.1 molybdopterin-guanine dinucleotide biosynthesis protein A [Luteibacter sp. Sphag1AF]
MTTGILLAGGRSSRMGRDKALLAWRGKPLIEHMHDVLVAAGARQVVVSGNRPVWGGVPDDVPDLGPVGGIASAAAALPDGDVLIVPVDMPRLRPGTLKALAEYAPCASFSGHPLPMCLRLDERSRAALHQLIATPGHECSVAALMNLLDGVRVTLDGVDTRELVNCNTPAEWLEVQP